MRATVVGACLLVACGGSSASHQGAAGSAGEAGASSVEAGAGGAAGSCMVSVPSPAVIASTPRADTNLELLALRLSSGVVAEQAIYDRVVRDVAAIREADPSLST